MIAKMDEQPTEDVWILYVTGSAVQFVLMGSKRNTALETTMMDREARLRRETQ